jgi:hypothetical protein
VILPEGAEHAEEALSAARGTAVRRALNEIRDDVRGERISRNEAAQKVVGLVNDLGLQSRQAQGFAPGSRPSDEAIEIGLRRRAVESAKDAEVLLRWLSRPRSSPSGLGLGLEGMGEGELEGLYAELLRLARLDEDELARLLSSS